MMVEPTLLSNFFLIGAAFAGAFIVALWISLIIWCHRDIRRRSKDPLMHVLAVLVVAILFLPGILIYLILRPPHTVEEEYQLALEEEALLQTVEENTTCPGCGRRINEQWQVCPSCHTRLKKTCQHCKKLMDLSWDICPYCATPVPGARIISNDTLQEDAAEDL
jgi:RNA polymerase subunit RPABC4/transcription elongation factor Spt4